MKAVNLIPADQRAGRGLGAGRSNGGAYAVLVVIAGFAIMALLYGDAAHKISSRNAELARIASHTQRVENQAEALSPYAGFISLQEKRVQAVETLLASRFDWANAIHELGRVLPSGTSVSSFAGTIGAPGATNGKPAAATSGGAVASSTPPGSVPAFTLSGCASSQRLVADLLARLRLMAGVSEVQLTSSTVSTDGGTASGAGSCPAHDPGYTVQVIFQPLPTAAAASAAASKAKLADTTSPAASSAAASGGSAR